jgi:hypothetical protein
MATRAKYTRVRQEEKKEDKPETDIIMKFSPTYGIFYLIKVVMLVEHLPYSLVKENLSLQLKRQTNLWIELSGLLRF